jgi:hypothetical protein
MICCINGAQKVLNTTACGGQNMALLTVSTRTLVLVVFAFGSG